MIQYIKPVQNNKIIHYNKLVTGNAKNIIKITFTLDISQHLMYYIAVKQIDFTG